MLCGSLSEDCVGALIRTVRLRVSLIDEGDVVVHVGRVGDWA